jgi:hypothetical protein
VTRSLGGALVFAGIVLALIGVLVWSGALTWFGRLPGDMRMERGSARVYFPLASMLLVSVVISVLAYLVRRWL